MRRINSAIHITLMNWGILPVPLTPQTEKSRGKHCATLDCDALLLGAQRQTIYCEDCRIQRTLERARLAMAKRREEKKEKK